MLGLGLGIPQHLMRQRQGALLRDGESLVFDFVNGRYAVKSLVNGRIVYSTNIHDLLTVERATPKWVYNASGKLTEVPANQPAYQHDPVTGEPQGILIEESRTNLLLWSEDFTNSVYANFGVEVIAVFTEGDALVTRVRLPEGATSTRIRQNFSGLVGTYTGSTLLRLVSGDPEGIRVVVISGGAVVEESKSLRTDRFTRVSVTGADVTAFDLFRRTGPGGGDIVVDVACAQLEEAATPSSYIPTEDAPVTRAADNVSRELGEEFNPSEGTFYFEGTANNTAGSVYSTVISLGRTTRSRMLLATGGSGGTTGVVRYDPAGNQHYFLGNVPHGQKYRAAVTFSVAQGVISVAQNGSVDGGHASFTSPLTPEMFLGSFGGGNPRASGEFGTVQYFPRALSEQELIDLTS